MVAASQPKRLGFDFRAASMFHLLAQTGMRNELVHSDRLRHGQLGRASPKPG